MTIIWPWSLRGHGGQCHYWLTMFDHGRPWPVSYGQFMVNDSQSCIRPWSTMVNHDHLEAYRPWSFIHGWWWSWYYWLTMVNHGWPWSIYWIWLPLTIIWPWLLTMVDHGQAWSFRGLSTMKLPSFDHGHYMVDDGRGTTDWPWSTMVDHGQYIGFDYHWPLYDHDYWPWSTIVMTIIPFYKHGRPWSDHGQLMVISWSTMVNDHDQPWSNHGRPWSDHDPVVRGRLGQQNVEFLQASLCRSLHVFHFGDFLHWQL